MTKRFRHCLVCVLAFAALAGCATRVAEPTGFLANRSEIARSKSVSTPDYEFRSAKDLPLAPGTKIYVAPVTVNLAQPGKVDAATRQRIADSFTRSLRAEVAAAFPVADSPAAAQIRLRTVVTQLKPAVPAVNLATSVYPSTRLSSELKQAMTGEQSFTGEATTELEAVRVSDGARVYAMMDKATGRKAITTSGSSWAPIEKLCQRWAKNLAATLRGAAPADAPESAPPKKKKKRRTMR